MSTIQFSYSRWGNFVSNKYSLVMRLSDCAIIGTEDNDGHICSLTEKDIEICNINKFEYKIVEKMSDFITELARKDDIIKKLENELTTLKNQKTFSVEQPTTDVLTKEQISKFVDKMLRDDMVNIELLPDWAEKKLYVNVLTLLVGLMRNALSSTSIETLGQKITFTVQPSTN